MLWQIYILFHSFHIVLTFYLGRIHHQPLSAKNLHDLVWDSSEVYPELGSKLYQGDIFMPANEMENGRNAIKINKYKWPNGTVPYSFNSEFNDEEKERIQEAMKYIESKTCVKFIPRMKEEDYIMINKDRDKGCYAMIGCRPKNGGPLPVNLQSPECLRHSGTIQHELLHVLGLLHEQSRPDRDKHVTIYWSNIDEKYKSDFGKASPMEVTTYDVPYDYQSVMHYPRDAFSKNGLDTIVAKKDPDIPLGQRNGATEGDLEKVRLMYECSPPPYPTSLFPEQLHPTNLAETLKEKLLPDWKLTK